MNNKQFVVHSDRIHCGDCPHLKPYGAEIDLTAKCDVTGNELMWHDYWVAECDPEKNEPPVFYYV